MTLYLHESASACLPQNLANVAVGALLAAQGATPVVVSGGWGLGVLEGSPKFGDSITRS